MWCVIACVAIVAFDVLLRLSWQGVVQRDMDRLRQDVVYVTRQHNRLVELAQDRLRVLALHVTEIETETSDLRVELADMQTQIDRILANRITWGRN